MKTKRMLAIVISAAVTASSVPGYAADFSDEIQMSANEELEKKLQILLQMS